MPLTKNEKNRTKKVSLRRLRANHYPEYLQFRNRLAKDQWMPGDLNNKQVTNFALQWLKRRYRTEWEILRQQAIEERI